MLFLKSTLFSKLNHVKTLVKTLIANDPMVYNLRSAPFFQALGDSDPPPDQPPASPSSSAARGEPPNMSHLQKYQKKPSSEILLG